MRVIRLSSLQQLDCLLAEDRGDLRVKLGGRLLVRPQRVQRRAARHRRRRLGTHPLRHIEVGALAEIGGFGDAPIQVKFGPPDARPQGVVHHQEESGPLIEVAGDGLHRAHAVREHGQVGIVQAYSAVEGFAQPVIDRIRQPHSVPGLGHG